MASKRVTDLDARRKERDEAVVEVYGMVLKTRQGFELIRGEGNGARLLGLDTEVPDDLAAPQVGAVNSRPPASRIDCLRRRLAVLGEPDRLFARKVTIDANSIGCFADDSLPKALGRL